MSLQMGEPKREKKKNRTPDKTDRHEGLAEQRDIIKIQRIQTYCKRKQKKNTRKTIELVYSISRQGRIFPPAHRQKRQKGTVQSPWASIGRVI